MKIAGKSGILAHFCRIRLHQNAVCKIGQHVAVCCSPGACSTVPGTTQMFTGPCMCLLITRWDRMVGPSVVRGARAPDPPCCMSGSFVCGGGAHLKSGATHGCGPRCSTDGVLIVFVRWGQWLGPHRRGCCLAAAGPHRGTGCCEVVCTGYGGFDRPLATGGWATCDGAIDRCGAAGGK